MPPGGLVAKEGVVNRFYTAGLIVLGPSRGREDQESHVHCFVPSFMALHGWVLPI
jgi:hypothetical protein